MPNSLDSKKKRKQAIATIRSYLGRYRKGLAIGGVCLLLTDALQTVGPWVLKIAIDDISDATSRERLFTYAAILVIASAVGGIFRFFMRRIMIGISRKIEADMRADFFAHLEMQSPEFYDKRRTGDLMALATNDLNAVRMLVGPAIMYSLNTLVMGAFSISLMLVLSWKLTIAALTPMLALIFVVYKGMKVIHRLFERVQARFAAINSRAQENLSGIRVVKAYAREGHEADEFERLSKDYLTDNMRLFRVQSVLHPLLMSIAGLGLLSILVFGGRFVIGGAITLGGFVAFNGYLVLLIWPMIAIGWTMNMIERGLASMQRINEVTSVEPIIVDPSPLDRVASERVAKCTIRFENVSFAYAGAQREVLRNLDFEIADGETVALVGPTGSGKSTLVSLILRLYDPTKGRITIGGVPIDRLSLEDLRSMIGLVPQDIFLFSTSIRENIGFGVSELDERRLLDVADIASIKNEIDSFPRGFESILGERGINLSGGQKQRVAIARAVARDPRVLILDDALSSVDATTEERILHSMVGEMENRTSIVISHRISTAREADRVLVLNDGELTEEGTHKELVLNGGIYADMYHKQMIMVDLERT